MKAQSLFLAITALGIAGCSTTPQEKFIKQQEAIEAKKVSQAKETVSNVPDWFIEYVQEDDSNIYAVATSSSTDPQVSMSDAKSMAIADAVHRMNATITSEKSILNKKDSDGNVSSTSKQIIDEYTGKQSVSGVTTIQRKLVQEGSKFRAYIMVAVKKKQSSNSEFEELNKEQAKLLNRE